MTSKRAIFQALFVISVIAFLVLFRGAMDSKVLKKIKKKMKVKKKYVITPEDRKWMIDKEADYDSLNQHIQRVCQKYDNNASQHHHIQGKNIMIDHWHKIAYCRNAKVGTSTWMHHFSLLDPKQRFVNKKGDLHGRIPPLFSIARQIHKGKSLRQFRQANNSLFFNSFFERNQYLTFTFIRHPFDRLVSAYLDKVDRSKHVWGHRVLVRKYGKSDFETFLIYVLNEAQKHPSNTNNHWKKFQDRCDFCNLKYDVIGRMETFDEDSKYVFLKGNLIKDLPLELSGLQVHKTKKKPKSFDYDGQPSDRTVSYFANVSKTTIEKVYELYRIDFELFQYNINGLI